MINPVGLLPFGIFCLLVAAWGLWPRFFWPAPDPEEGSGDTIPERGVAGEPAPSPAVSYAWRRPNMLGGDILSRPFDTPQEAGRYRAAVANPEHMTLIRLEDGHRREALGEEACAAILEWVNRTREMA